MISERVIDGELQPFYSAPRDWEGETCVIVGTGPSITQEQVDYCRGKARMIVVNDAFKLAPWADVLWGCDGKWWNWHSQEAVKFKGERITLDVTIPWQWAELMHNSGAEGYDERPWCIRTGSNGGFQAAHLAIHRGAKKILLIGFDHRGEPGNTHFFGDHPDKIVSPYEFFIKKWGSLVGPARERGIEIINCTLNSALNVWPIEPLEDHL